MLDSILQLPGRADAFIDSWPAVLLFLLGVPLMLYGADRLVNAAVILARRLGVSVLLIGLTIVAAGTSAPELTINIIAALNDNTDLSFGNVIGSNIANIGLIVGIGALMTPMFVHSAVIRREIPWLMLISIVVVIMAFVPIVRLTDGDGTGARLGFGRVDGILLLVGFLAIAWAWYRTCRADESDPIRKEVEDVTSVSGPSSTSGAGLFFLGGLALLLIGGKMTEAGAIKAAEALNLSQAVIGLTVVAVATSLPELVTTIIACRKGHADLAVGNIVGSNLFNILLVLGATAVVADVPLPASTGWQDLLVMLLLAAMLWWMSLVGRQEVSRRQGGLLLGIYTGYLLWSVVREWYI